MNRSKVSRCFFFVALASCMGMMPACSHEPSNREEFMQEKAYDIGYEDGYDAGVEYVLSTLRENAHWRGEYLNPEDVRTGVDGFCKEYPSTNDETLLNHVLYDNDTYSMDELLEELIQSCIDSDYYKAE